MKQHITVEQVKELSQETIAKIDDQLYSAMYFYAKLERGPRWDFAANLLTIGKMIEIIKYCDIRYTVDNGYWPVWEVDTINENSKIYTIQDEELADALWEAVKYVLGDN